VSRVPDIKTHLPMTKVTPIVPLVCLTLPVLVLLPPPKKAHPRSGAGSPIRFSVSAAAGNLSEAARCSSFFLFLCVIEVNHRRLSSDPPVFHENSQGRRLP